MAFEDQTVMDSYLHDIRNEAIGNFETHGFPTRKDEEWKYTPLNSLLKENYTVFPQRENTIEFKDVKKNFIHEIDSYKLVFIDGVYSSFLSETTHDGMDICLMSAALTKPKYKMVIDRFYNKAVDKKSSLASLNTAFATEGAYINIPKGKIVNKPIQILHFSTGQETAQMLFPRNLIVVGENAHVEIIERHQNLSSNKVLTNSVTEIFANKRAIVDYYKIQNDQRSASLLDHTFIEQKQESNCSVHTFSFGGQLTRNNLHFYQRGEHIQSTLKGITMIGEKQLVDHHTLVAHNHPNCESFQEYKGIFDESATGVFNGKVIVQKEAQKTNAYQQNNNLLTGDKATVNTKPQLEIFADDVKCSHGCTIGQLDKKSLFYLRSRGIPEKEARALLMYAFANDVLSAVRIPEIKTRITKIIANQIGVQLGFNI